MQSIFVTGAASGIGNATAELFGAPGWFVGCYDVDAEGARAVAERLGPKSRHGRVDVTSLESWRTALADFEPAAGGMNVLFNCAGILRMGRFEEVSPEECRRQLDVNVMGVILGIQASLPILASSRGRIVNMSSASAVYGQPDLAVYSATKFAVRALTEALDIELRDRGVTACDVMPGYVDTPMVHDQTHHAPSLGKLGIKLGPADVAAVVWKAAHGRGLHYVPQKDVQLLSRVGGLLPELGRLVMRRVARAPSGAGER